MWHYLVRFEGILFFPLYLIYASLTGTRRSIKCGKCRRWLFTYKESALGVCSNCEKEDVSHPTRLYDNYHHRMVELIGLAPIVGSYRHKPVAEKVGEGKVLDVGCGRGELLARLRSQRRELYGFDLSATAAKVAKTICKDTNFFVADARYIPFKSNTFDYIICTEVLEHIEGDDAIRECHRVLKPNGSALFTIPNERGIWGVPQHRGGHVRQFTFKSFCLLSGTAKFEIVSGYGYGLYIPIFSHLFLLIAAVFKRKLPLAGPLNIKVPEFLATNFLIECRKPPI